MAAVGLGGGAEEEPNRGLLAFSWFDRFASPCLLLTILFSLPAFDHYAFTFLPLTFCVLVWPTVGCRSTVSLPCLTIVVPCLTVFVPYLPIFVPCLTVFVPCLTIFVPCLTIFVPCVTLFRPRTTAPRRTPIWPPCSIRDTGAPLRYLGMPYL